MGPENIAQVQIIESCFKSTYGIQLWGTASTSNIEILESFQ
jgi:hypothetical protein